MKPVRLVIASNGISYLEMRSVQNQILLSIEPWAEVRKLYASVAVPPASDWVPTQRPLAPTVN